MKKPARAPAWNLAGRTSATDPIDLADQTEAEGELIAVKAEAEANDFGFDAGDSPADVDGVEATLTELTEESLRQHHDSLPDRCPSWATSVPLCGIQETQNETAATSLVPGETYAMPETQDQTRLGGNCTGDSPTQAEETPKEAAEQAKPHLDDETASLASMFSTMPPGSEAGLSTTASSFKLGSATRSEASTKSSGDLESIMPLCQKCGFPTDVLNAILKTKASAHQHAKYVCRPCNSIQTMVYRNIKQEGPLRMATWDTEQLNDFYRRAQEVTTQDGRMHWHKIRDTMKKVMVKRVIESTEKLVNSEFKPLGVWGKLGYDVEMIAAYNKTEWNPAVGMTYAVPLKSIAWSKKEEEVEEHLAKAEMAMGGDRNQRGGRAADDDDDDDDDDVTSPPKGRDVNVKRRKLEADAAKEAKKEHAAVKAHNSKMHILASKTLTALSNGADVLKKVTHNKNFSSAPTFMAEKVNNDLETAASYLKESDNVLKVMKKCAKDGTRLPTLSYDAKELGDLSKAVRKDISDFEAFEKLCR